MNNNIYDVPTSTDQLVSGNKMYLGSRAGQRMDCNGYLHLLNGSIWDGEGEENFWISPHISKWTSIPKRDIFLVFLGYYCLSFLEQPQNICQHIFLVRRKKEISWRKYHPEFVQLGFVWVVESRDTSYIYMIHLLGFWKRVNQLLQALTSWMGC